MDYCIDAGVYGIINFGMGMTLRAGDREYFYAALDKHFPGLKEQFHHKYGYAYQIASSQNAKLMKLFHKKCRAHGIVDNVEEMFQYLSTFPQKEQYQQLWLF